MQINRQVNKAIGKKTIHIRMDQELKEPCLESQAQPSLQPCPKFRFHEAASELVGFVNLGPG